MLKAAYDVLASSAETIGAFSTDSYTVNLHRPTTVTALESDNQGACVQQTRDESTIISLEQQLA
jgi:hypothetical protein